jgi:maleate cis-trans isomerase
MSRTDVLTSQSMPRDSTPTGVDGTFIDQLSFRTHAHRLSLSTVVPYMGSSSATWWYMLAISRASADTGRAPLSHVPIILREGVCG